MSQQEDGRMGKLLRGAFAGMVAGATASFAMDLFQTALMPLSSSGDDESQEPATQKAANGVAKALTGSALSSTDKPLAGQAMHYALGIGLGVAYGIAAELYPGVTAGVGTAFGLGTATLLDEALVPLVGLGRLPWKAGPTSNLDSYASHLVFGSTTELVRRQVAGTLKG